jgi:hypothetical protein
MEPQNFLQLAHGQFGTLIAIPRNPHSMANGRAGEAER